MDWTACFLRTSHSGSRANTSISQALSTWTASRSRTEIEILKPIRLNFGSLRSVMTGPTHTDIVIDSCYKNEENISK